MATNERALSELTKRQVGHLADVVKAQGGIGGGAAGLTFRATEQTKDALSNLIKSQFGFSTRGITAGAGAVKSTEENIRKIEVASGITRTEAAELERLLSSAATTEERSLITIEYLRSINKLDALRRLAPLATDAELATILRQGNKTILENPGYIAKIKKRTRS